MCLSSYGSAAHRTNANGKNVAIARICTRPIFGTPPRMT
jgi:hypothetical protein